MTEKGEVKIEEIRGAVARGWCHQPNSAKVFDGELAEAISQEVAQIIAAHCPVEQTTPRTDWEAGRDAALDAMQAWGNSSDPELFDEAIAKFRKLTHPEAGPVASPEQPFYNAETGYTEDETAHVDADAIALLRECSGHIAGELGERIDALLRRAQLAHCPVEQTKDEFWDCLECGYYFQTPGPGDRPRPTKCPNDQQTLVKREAGPVEQTEPLAKWCCTGEGGHEPSCRYHENNFRPANPPPMAIPVVEPEQKKE
jgi:hypothetical protein